MTTSIVKHMTNHCALSAPPAATRSQQWQAVCSAQCTGAGVSSIVSREIAGRRGKAVRPVTSNDDNRAAGKPASVWQGFRLFPCLAEPRGRESAGAEWARGTGTEGLRALSRTDGSVPPCPPTAGLFPRRQAATGGRAGVNVIRYA